MREANRIKIQKLIELRQTETDEDRKRLIRWAISRIEKKEKLEGRICILKKKLERTLESDNPEYIGDIKELDL